MNPTPAAYRFHAYLLACVARVEAWADEGPRHLEKLPRGVGSCAQRRQVDAALAGSGWEALLGRLPRHRLGKRGFELAFEEEGWDGGDRRTGLRGQARRLAAVPLRDGPAARRAPAR